MTHKFYISVCGGVGDTIRRYTSKGDGWEYLQSLKESFPDSRVRLIIMSSNPQAAEFFKYHPLIDDIVVTSWANPNIRTDKAERHAGDYIKLKGNPILSSLKERRDGRVFLAEEDREIVSSVAEQGDYVLIHPFSSEKRKMPLPIEEYFPLVDRIIDNLNLNAVIVGADWTETRNGPAKRIKEEFPYERPGLINLINKANSRIAINLVQNSVGIIVVRSFCFSASIAGNIKTVLLVPPQGCKNYLGPRRTLNNLKQLNWPLKNIKIIGVTKNYKAARDKIFGEIK